MVGGHSGGGPVALEAAAALIAANTPVRGFVAQQVEDNERRVWNKMQRARLIACAHADSLLERLSGGKHPSCYGLMEYIDMPEESSDESSDDE